MKAKNKILMILCLALYVAGSTLEYNELTQQPQKEQTNANDAN